MIWEKWSNSYGDTNHSQTKNVILNSKTFGFP